MILAVSGTQNIGKTTLIKDFISKYPRFKTPVIDYRKLIAQHNLKINREGNLKSQQMLLDFIISDLDNHKEDVILDRSCIDAYVYGLWHYLNRPVEAGYTAEDIRFQFEQMRAAVTRYDKIFFIPLRSNPNIPIEDDLFRDTNLEYRAEIDGLFTKVIYSLGEEFVNERVLEVSGTREERIAQISKSLNF